MIYSATGTSECPEIDRGGSQSTRIRGERALDTLCRAACRAKKSDDLLKASTFCSTCSRRARVIAGHGPLRERLLATAHDYHLDEHVKFLGHREDVPRLMAAADLIVLPSSYEGMPNVVLEAMQFRKPVVATAAPGTTEVVVDGQTGLLVPIGNPPLLARAIRDVIRDPTLARRLGEAGRARVDACFSNRDDGCCSLPISTNN